MRSPSDWTYNRTFITIIVCQYVGTPPYLDRQHCKSDGVNFVSGTTSQHAVTGFIQTNDSSSLLTADRLLSLSLSVNPRLAIVFFFIKHL